MQQYMVPVQDQVLLRNLAAASNHQLDHFFEVGLAGRDLGWVYISSLEGSEKKLAGGGVVAVWSHHRNRYLKPL